jgi:hypothetical protein
MNRTSSIICPSCHAPLTSMRGMRIGKKIACPHCRIAFLVRPEDAEQAERAAGVNAGRLRIVLAGALVYLLVGAALAGYCFSHNLATKSAVQIETGAQDPENDGDDGTGVPAALPPTPALPRQRAVSAAEQRKIDAAITDGVWYLRSQSQPSGSWEPGGSVGFAALPGLTLLECGVPENDPLVQKAAALVRQKAVQVPADAHGTYQVALAILFLDRLGASEDDDLIRYLALCLMAGQHPGVGAWHYSCPVLQRAMVPELLTLLADDKQTLADWRTTALRGGTFDTQGWDNSNTQFAILALWVARRHQVPIDKSIALVEKHFRGTQMSAPAGGTLPDPDGNNLDLDGSWYYGLNNARGWGNSSRWPSMTCSGLLGLAIGHGVGQNAAARQHKPLDDPAIQRGLAMLAREIDRPGEKRPPDLYYLWSLERVGVLYDLPAIGGKDWYAWGYHVLLPLQRNDGSWRDGGYFGNHPVLDTCFALLFLKQANLAKDLTDKLQLLGKPPPKEE